VTKWMEAGYVCLVHKRLPMLKLVYLHNKLARVIVTPSQLRTCRIKGMIK